MSRLIDLLGGTELDETVQQVRTYLDGRHQVIDHGQVGWFRLYTVQPVQLVVAGEGAERDKERSKLLKKPIKRADYLASIKKDPYGTLYKLQPFAGDGAANSELHAKVKEASKLLAKMGARRQRDVLIALDLGKRVNRITGGGVGGSAYRTTHAIEIDPGVPGLPELIAHEWGHKWFFNAPKHVKRYVSRWFERNIATPVSKLPVTYAPAKKRGLYVTYAWHKFAQSWAEQSGMRPQNYMRTRKAIKGARPGSSSALIISFLNAGVRALAVRLVKSPRRGSGFRKGDLAHFTALPTGGFRLELQGKRAVEGNVEPLELTPEELSLVEIDLKATKKILPSGMDLDMLRYTAHELTDPDQDPDPARYFTRENRIFNALDAAIRELTNYLVGRYDGYEDVRSLMGSSAQVDFAKEWVARAKREGDRFDPEKAFKDIFTRMVQWEPKTGRGNLSPEQTLTMLSTPAGKHLRRKARELGVVPTDYAAANVDELWAEAIAYAATNPSKLPRPLKEMIRNAFQGQTNESTDEHEHQDVLVTQVGDEFIVSYPNDMETDRAFRDHKDAVAFAKREAKRWNLGYVDQTFGLEEAAKLDAPLPLKSGYTVTYARNSKMSQPWFYVWLIHAPDGALVGEGTFVATKRGGETLDSRLEPGARGKGLYTALLKHLRRTFGPMESNSLGLSVDAKRAWKRAGGKQFDPEGDDDRGFERWRLESQLGEAIKATDIQRQLRDPKYPAVAEKGKGYCFHWADGRGICAFRRKDTAIAWLGAETDMPRAVVRWWYGEPVYGKDKEKRLTVRDDKPSDVTEAQYVGDPKGPLRAEMPQITAERVADFLRYLLREHGIPNKRARWTVSKLRPTQRTISHAGVESVRKRGGRLGRALIVSRDGYVVDGHHRWKYLQLDEPDAVEPVIEVQATIRRVLEAARAFSGTEYRDSQGQDVKLSEYLEDPTALQRPAVNHVGADEPVAYLTGQPVHLAHGFGPITATRYRHILSDSIDEDLEEGVNDPYIFKVVFMAGGAGSGKGFISSTMFNGMGLKVVNSDDQLEAAMKKAGLSLKKDIGLDVVQRPGGIRDRAKALTAKKLDLYIMGRLGIIVDSTAKDPGKIEKQVRNFRSLGYDASMVFVNTSLEVARERNQQRARTVPDKILVDTWNKAQANMRKFERLFGKANFIEIVNDEVLTPAQVTAQLVPRLHRAALKLVSKPVRNPVAQKWIDAQTGSSAARQPKRPSMVTAQNEDDDESPRSRLAEAKVVIGDVRKSLPDSMDVPRAKMPQIQSKDMAAFLRWLRDEHGLTVSSEKVAVGRLKPTQKELNTEKVVGFADGALPEHKLRLPVVASNDDRILDGHHRWAALHLREPSNRIQVHRVNVPMRRLLELGRSFPRSFTKKLAEAGMTLSELLATP